MKVINDKYYTPEEVVEDCLTFVRSLNLNVSEIIEPSAGDGAFSKKIKNCTAYDIAPEDESIIKADFLTLDVPYKEGRLIIGNPPFGNSNSGSVRFFKKAVEMADYIAFIQPISQYKNNLQMYQFDLISSTDLGVKRYTDRDLHCCFNVYKRPTNGLNPKPDYTLKDVTIIEHRRKKGDYQTAKNKEISPNYDYAMCNWGNGSLGKVPKYVGQYAQEVYFYVHNRNILQNVKDVLQYDVIREYVNSVSMKRISVMRLYKYLRDTIRGIK